MKLLYTEKEHKHCFAISNLYVFATCIDKSQSAQPCCVIQMSTVYQEALKSFCVCYLNSADACICGIIWIYSGHKYSNVGFQKAILIWTFITKFEDKFSVFLVDEFVTSGCNFHNK